ncbi:MAG: toxin, partial [Candidatus Binatia bacterium]
TFRGQLEKAGGVYVIDRVKNRDALIELGLTKEQREEVILSLTPEDYCGGPYQDREGPGMWWVFGKKEEGREIYIRLKVTHAPICLSFHPAEQPLEYPHKGRKEGR